ncbi:hypothetical protein KJ953_02065 [Patescibacteria group bacterium]|nr:hypothetical protein [Patescibacteria group bacterium]MBU1256462.1 hypothetical protein [Patescibacteria group bacterium]MBU1457264.1 hypothetical protein [Patescibacteria group bacterium]
MNKVTLQIPVSQTLRDQATLSATKLGFSSLQESIRLFMTQLATKEITISFTPKTRQLSPAAIKRYNKMIASIETGETKTYKADSVNELMHHLTK